MRIVSVYSVCALLSLIFTVPSLKAQSVDWQQNANYRMTIDVDADSHSYEGEQRLQYTNGSPDTLYRVFYHLYFNAFQPNSMMDMRSRTILDPDKRVGDRISKLGPDEIGFIKVKSLNQDGVDVTYETVETILEVELAEPLTPGMSTVLTMEWDAQIPLQIRRSGRDNAEGVDFSMAQWYPKICEYDAKGWHANPYVGREFYGVWGDFDVTIIMDKEYLIGATGMLMNPQEVGHGYGGYKKGRPEKGKLTWRFNAMFVHDFVWAADKDYILDTRETMQGVKLYFLYQDDDEIRENWKKLQPDAERLFELASERYGQYHYPVYSIIQGGDGGMEYPMATLITGNRSYGSLLGVTVHEVMHSWYQMSLATNEALYPWMDEGFTSYTTAEIMAEFFPKKPSEIHAGGYRGYRYIVERELEEPLSTHADHYETNVAYGVAAYSKGEVFLHQLGYIIGEEVLDKVLLRYYNQWSYRHPDVYDFIRIAEKESGMELDWYVQYFVNSVKTIDYGLTMLEETEVGSRLTIERQGKMIMPVDVLVETVDGENTMYHIPLGIMRGEKTKDSGAGMELQVLEDWFWTHPTYHIDLPHSRKEISKIQIDPSQRLADMDLSDNAIYLEDGRIIIEEEEEDQPEE